MKLKGIFTLFLAGAALTSTAQTHVEGAEYFKADQFENAKDLLLRSLNNPGTDKAITDYYLGLIALQENNEADARKYFSDGVAANPEYAYNYVGEGLLLLRADDLKGAEAKFKEADKLSKKDPALQIAVARAYDTVDPVKYEKQIAKYVEKARRFDMQDPAIYVLEGDQLREKKDWGGAAAKYEMAANYDKNATEAYVKYANLFTMVNPDYAIKMLSNLLANTPDSALGQRELANAYYNNKDFKSAAAEYGKYVQNPSHFKKDEDRYAFLLFYGNDYKKGYDYSTALLKENPSNFTAQRYQFMNAAQLPEMKDALAGMADKLYAAHVANPAQNKFAPIDYILIAQEYNTADRPDEAQKILEKAIQEDPKNPAFYKELAMTYVEGNNLTKATEAYEGYLANSDEPGYNDFIQQATFAFYAGVENKTKDTAAAEKFYGIAKDYASKAAAILPDNYKPVKFDGDIALQKAAEADVASAAVPYYQKAIDLLEASPNRDRYATDAKTMYNYMGNYYLDQKDVAKAKEYFVKYLQLDPNNEDYRKFVESLK